MNKTEETWDDIRNKYYKFVADTNSSQPFVEWLKENYKVPQKK